jgi:ferrous iron transport protein A
MTKEAHSSSEVVALFALRRGCAFRIERIVRTDDDWIADRLTDLGFVPGERARVIARAPWGGDPLVVQIGFTRFALRKAEAERVLVHRDPR